MTEKTIIGFDYGTKRIGVAVGQTLTQSATPVDTVNFIRNKPDWKHIEKLIQQWNPDALVVGVPLSMDDKRQVMTDASEHFSRQLHGRFRLPVFNIDERLSSWEARDRLQNSYDVDAVAAQVILETWFSQRENVE